MATKHELTLYGEVREKRPVNWWTGEPAEGFYAALDDVVKSLAEIPDGAELTVRINSPGGDMNAGVAIYNRLRERAGKTTVVVDALAASAASLIAMAGDKLVMRNGSRMMVHEARVWTFGYYSAEDLEKEKAYAENANAASREIYAARTGLDNERLKELMRAETWMTGLEAAALGFDVIIDEDGEKAEIALSADRKLILANGRRYAAAAFCNIPSDIPAAGGENPAEKARGEGPQEKKEEKELEAIQTAAELARAYPDLVGALQASAAEEAAAAERTRIQEIEAVAGEILDAELVEAAKYGGKRTTAQELAYAAMKKNAEAAALFAKNLDEQKGAQTPPAPNGGNESADREKAEIQAAAAAIVGGGEHA
jgi:ATP-dependent protease ClpP protease subunit